MLRTRKRSLVGALLALAALLAANSVLGPLLSGRIDYHYGESMTNQGIGLDAVALFVVVPVALLAARLVQREHLAGPVLAFLPGSFAAYMAPQYVIGPDYLGLPGNNEQWFLLHLHLLLLGVAVLLLAWQQVDRIHLLPATRASDVRRTVLMLAIAAFVVLRWFPLFPELLSGTPSSVTFVDNPTAFMLIMLLDLAIVVPAALTAAFGLWTGALWGRSASYALIGFFAVVPLSVAAMAVTMVLNGDPNGSMPVALGFCAVAIVSAIGSLLLYHPLSSEQASLVPASWSRTHRQDH